MNRLGWTTLIPASRAIPDPRRARKTPDEGGLRADLPGSNRKGPGRLHSPEATMATAKQSKAARQNVGKAQKAAASKRTIANMPKRTRTALGQQGAAAAQRK